MTQLLAVDDRPDAAPPPACHLLDRQRAAFLRDGPPSLAARRRDLKALKAAILGRRDRFVEAVSADFGHRSRQETTYMDLMPTAGAIDYLSRNLGRWMRPERRRVALHFQPGANRVHYQPLGVVGIISPWNYPVALALIPLATAIAAGNRAMLKPSEFTPLTSALIAETLATIFPPEQVAVVAGDAEVAAAFAALPFDHLVFTGSTAIGHAVMRAASDNLVPVTLELGGKSPLIVERGSSLRRAARGIVFGKFANAGQTCVGVDYALVPDEAMPDMLAAIEAEIASFYPDIARNPDYATIVTDRHFARLEALLDDAAAKGATVHRAAPADARPPLHPRTFAPAIVTGLTDAMRLAHEEIFGPILPLIPYRSLDDAIAYVNARPRPLALYYFGHDDDAIDRVLVRTTSGGVSINETLLHYAQDDLPFGGVGPSGLGAYHGVEGFRALSHAKGVFTQSRLNIIDAIRPPFGAWFDRAMAFLLR